MTTLGKILVFLVFIAALAMGGLMVFSPGPRQIGKSR